MIRRVIWGRVHEPPDTIVSAALVKGHATHGLKYCWGYEKGYSAGIHPTASAAQSAVEGNREGGWGIQWEIVEYPCCLVKGSNSALLFSVSSGHSELPRLPDRGCPSVGGLLPSWDTRRPRARVAVDIGWNPWEPPFFRWTAESRSGSSALIWYKGPSDVGLQPGCLEWIAHLHSRAQSQVPSER
jgi:hypothetical protein